MRGPRGLGLAVKRAADVGLAVVGGLVLLPLLGAVALAIKLHDGGPVFYVSERVGLGGHSFPFYKFRSMIVDADRQRDSLPNEKDGPLFKLTGDPRITPIGAVIRRWSVDELPQLWNVLRGDMHLVGPRPLPRSDLQGCHDLARYQEWARTRTVMRPGITGLWQIRGRSDLPFAQMIDYDLEYVRGWSLALDLRILIGTIPAVLGGRGAR